MSLTVNPTLAKSDLNPAVKGASDNAGNTETKTVDTDFYNPFDGTKGRAGGVYLDVEERNNAEILRAQSEKREADLDTAPAVAGTPLVTKENLVDNSFSNPSSQAMAPVKQVDPVSTLPVSIPGTSTAVEPEPESETSTTVDDTTTVTTEL